MLLEEFLAPRILIVAGKGGVGKTTVAAALALVAARSGRRVCIAQIDRKGTLPKLFGREALSYDPSELSPGVWGMEVVVEEAMAEYLEVQYHIRRISRVLTGAHFIDYITTAAPGLKDIFVLGKIWYLEQGRPVAGASPKFDTIIVDAQAAGHMLTFLSAPMGLSDTVQVGPVRKQSDWLGDMLRNPARTRVHIVTLLEEMPVAETLETTAALDERLGISSGAVFANAVYSEALPRNDWLEAHDGARLGGAGGLTKPLAGRSALRSEAKAAGITLDDEDFDALFAYARFLEARQKVQRHHLRALRRGAARPVVELPFLFSAGLALPDIDRLADVIQDGIAAL